MNATTNNITLYFSDKSTKAHFIRANNITQSDIAEEDDAMLIVPDYDDFANSQFVLWADKAE